MGMVIAGIGIAGILGSIAALIMTRKIFARQRKELLEKSKWNEGEEDERKIKDLAIVAAYFGILVWYYHFTGSGIRKCEIVTLGYCKAWNGEKW